MEIPSLLSRKTNKVKAKRPASVSKKRLIFFLSIILIFLGLVSSRIFFLTIVRGEYYQALANQNKNRISWQEAPRGIIFDRNKNQLVYNEPQFRLVLSSQLLPESKPKRNQISSRLEKILDRSREEIKSVFRKSENLYFQSSILKEQLSRKKAIKLRSQFSDLKAVQVRQSNQRSYEYGPLLAHLLGYTSLPTAAEVDSRAEILTTSQVGRKGLEKQYDQLLQGKPGKKVVEVNAYGKEQRLIENSKPKPGKNLIISLDLKLQRIITEEINKLLDSEDLKKAAVIASDPQNGEILALASIPSFDNNNFSEKYEQYKKQKANPLLNRVTQNRYPPGSTFKPILALAGLEEGVITPESKVDCHGQIQVGSNGAIFEDWRTHGIVDLKKAIAESCNVYFYTIGGGYGEIKGLGIEKINKYAKMFSFKEEPPIDLPYKKKGLVPNPNWKREKHNTQWYKGDTYNVSIGQGATNLTPLHINNMMSFFANGEAIYRPHLMKKVIDQKGNVKKQVQPTKFKEPKLKMEHIVQVREALRETVISGTAQYLKNLPVKAAGKTGTAQFGFDDSTHGWFSGFAPYESPEIVLTIMIEEGGGSEALPVLAAKRILNRYFDS